MKSKQNNITEWSVRHAIFDMVDLGIIDVPYKTQIMQFVKEEINSENLFLLYEFLNTEQSSSNTSKFIKEMHVEYLKENNPNISIINENLFNDQRNFVLLNEEDDKTIPTITGKDINDVIKKAGIGGAIYWLLKVGSTPKRRKEVSDAIKSYGELYDKARANTILDKIAPTWKELETGVKKTAKHPVAGGYETIKTFGSKAVTGSKKTIPHQIKIPNINARYLLITSGVIAAIAGAYKTYKYYVQTAEARNHCGELKGTEKDKCMLKFQIHAAKIAISKLQEAKTGCPQKSNPEKCIYSFNQSIWKWNKRIQKWETKLKKLEKVKTQETTKSDTTPF